MHSEIDLVAKLKCQRRGVEDAAPYNGACLRPRSVRDGVPDVPNPRAAAHISTWLAAKSKCLQRADVGIGSYADYETVCVNAKCQQRALDERPYGAIR